MPRRRLLWQLYPSYVTITLVALLAVSWFFSDALRDFYLRETAQDLAARLRLVENQVQKLLLAPQPGGIDALCKDLGRRAATRLTVVAFDGRVLGDSEEDPQRMDNHANRPEILTALAQGEGVATRYSHTLRQTMLYVARPLVAAGETVGVIRGAIPVTAIETALWATYRRIAAVGLLIAVPVALVVLVVSRRLSRPLEKMRQGAQRFAAGDLRHRLAVPDSEELGGLAEAMNRMAQQLDERLQTVVRQRNEQEAMLASMVEGVLAVDTGGRILRVNRAAARFLDLDAEGAVGRRIQEVVRKADLQRFVAETLRNDYPIEGDVLLQMRGEERAFQAHGSVLQDPQGGVIGALIVLHDVTHLRRLEALRKDFVANVSHELKTPITAIKGSVETLQGGALEEPEAAARFLSIVARQSERLEAIIDDLLSLSRIEQDVEGEGLVLSEEALRPVLEGAIGACEVSAREKAVKINLFCSPELRARINPALLEQAVINLLSNAIKYSHPRGTVTLEAGLFDREVSIRVQDFGCGIAAPHLPRLFERFYRVDQARSRALGGTGLGLAIVKHIVQSHGGRVMVTSTPGQGSVFTLFLPAE